MSKKITTKEFIEKAKTIHGDKYDYGKTIYIKAKQPVIIYCKKCKKYFQQRPDNHIHGEGCYNCGRKTTAKKCRTQFLDVLSNFKLIHENKYCYDDVEYKNNKTKIKIYCKKCKEYFWQTPYAHGMGQGCPKCGNIKKGITQSMGGFTFIKKSKEKYGDQYKYDFVVYKNNVTKVKIFCTKCKKFFYQYPGAFLRGFGCCCCSPKSKGEEFIKKILSENNIKFEAQKRFKNCKDKLPLPFDFYLPDYNLCIEYQGEQHYDSSFYKMFCKNEKLGNYIFNRQCAHDKIKKQFCIDNNIDFLEIRYDEDIDEKLMKKLKEYN